ncbi:hypothetical protein Hdeb2414_s0020g00554981 [Helianthus debilis subsp. tardiflorus]
MEGPSTEECYEKLKLVGLEPIDPLFLAAFNIFGQYIQMRQAWMTLPSDPEVLKGWIKMTRTTLGMFNFWVVLLQFLCRFLELFCCYFYAVFELFLTANCCSFCWCIRLSPASCIESCID